MLNDKFSEMPRVAERGSALILAIIALCVLALVGASFSLMIQSEARSIEGQIISQEALYAAESGVENVLFQRTKEPGQMCYPYYMYDEDLDPTQRIEYIQGQTGAPPGGLDSAPTGTCDPTVDSIPEDEATQELPCWPYNERLYANQLHFAEAGEVNDGFDCHDGSNSTVCPDYDPLLYWPADKNGNIGWKDVIDDVDGDGNTDGTLESPEESSGARFTTGFFVLCNDSFEGVAPSDPGYEKACLAAKGGGRCNQTPLRISIVSVGEVQVSNKVVRKAVKMDMQPAALFSGVIDKYVDMTGMLQANINGPIHINGWWNGNKWNAFLLSLSMSAVPIISWLDPPELVSVSFPEDPKNPDWQPSDLLGGISFSHDIVYVHLPVRIEIPQVNWSKFENRMNELYKQAYDDYNDGTVVELFRCKFKKADPAYGDYRDYWDTSGDCGDSGEQYPYDAGGSRSDDKMDAGLPKFMSSMSPNPSPYNTGAERIHNLQRYKSDAQVWGSSTKYIFDLFDHWGYYGTDWVQGEESCSVDWVTYEETEGKECPGAKNPGPRDESLRFKYRFVLDPHFDLGCVVDVIMDGISLKSFMDNCVGKVQKRNEFWFMGKHEFRDFVFIDGVMGIGYRTPYHTCGGGDGGLGVYCIVVPKICLFWPLDWLCIPSWKFGLPHWHMGSGVIKGELLVNGRLYLSDWIHIDGGTIYADSHVTKDETSGYDIILHLDTLICWILTGMMGPSITIDLGVFGEINICDVVFAVLNPIITALVPWWPEFDLTNNGLIDFESYLDVDGLGPQSDVVASPGVLYTRGDFRQLEPGWDVINFLGNALLGFFLPFLELTPAMDPIRIYNGGAIIAGGRWVGGDVPYKDGNVYLTKHRRGGDILTSNPDGDSSVGYAMARGSLTISGDLVSHYGMGGLIDKCSTTSVTGLSADCAAAGIFYSGGISAGTNPRNMYSYLGGSVGLKEIGETEKFLPGLKIGVYDHDFNLQCLAVDDGFWDDPLGSIGCWGGAALDFLGGNAQEHNIRGHVFAGQVGAMPTVHFRLDQDASVRNDAVKRNYFKQLGGVPLNWIEVDPPQNLPSLLDGT